MLLPLLLSSLLAAPTPAPVDAPAAAPVTVTREQALTLLLGDAKPREEGLVAFEPWKAHPGTWLVATAWQSEEEPSQWFVRVGWVGLKGSTPGLLASGEPVPIEFGEPLLNNMGGLGFDFAPYRISPQETAFGLRMTMGYTSTARSSTYGQLVLFRRVEQRLAAIFNEEVSSSSFDKESGEETGSASIVIVSPKKTGSFFDLVLKPHKGLGKARTLKWNESEGRYE